MDLNHRPPGPEPGALARLRYAPTVHAQVAQNSRENQARIAQLPSRRAVPANIRAAISREIIVRDDSPRTTPRRSRDESSPARTSSPIFPLHESKRDSPAERSPRFSSAPRAQIRPAAPPAPLLSPDLVPTKPAPATSRFQSPRFRPAVASRRNQSSPRFLSAEVSRGSSRADRSAQLAVRQIPVCVRL